MQMYIQTNRQTRTKEYKQNTIYVDMNLGICKRDTIYCQNINIYILSYMNNMNYMNYQYELL